MPSVAFGVSCALAELAETLPQAANYRAAPLCNGDPDDLILKLADMPGEKVAKVKVGIVRSRARRHGGESVAGGNSGSAFAS